jgi:hypothetical protein
MISVYFLSTAETVSRALFALLWRARRHRTKSFLSLLWKTLGIRSNTSACPASFLLIRSFEISNPTPLDAADASARSPLPERYSR